MVKLMRVLAVVWLHMFQ